MPAVSPRPVFRRPRGLRGFTLIELAVVMAVVGLLLGASLLTTRALDERRQLREELRNMEAARDAIVGYALRHRTRAREIHFYGLQLRGDGTPIQGRPFFLRAFRLPAGRPYLPCPDWDGDGFEDRYPEGGDGFARGVEVKPDLTVTATVAAAGADARLIWHARRLHGACLVERGALPWRTLGVAPADRWGNRHTYFVDLVFSNAIFGFDRRTIADIYDPHMPRTPGRRRAIRHYNAPTHARMCPAVICDGARTTGDCARHSLIEGVRFCAWNEDAERLALKAGAAAGAEISAPFDGKYFPAGGVTDGLPFVLLSHGRNGRFAVNHWATLQNPTNEAGLKGPICNHDAWAEADERSDGLVVSANNHPLLHEAMNGSRRAQAPEGRCERLVRDDFLFSINHSFFAWEPPGASDGSDFDDLLLWSTRDELMLAFPDNIPRLPPMTVPYFPNLR